MRKIMTSILSVKCQDIARSELWPASKYHVRSNVRTVTQLLDQSRRRSKSQSSLSQLYSARRRKRRYGAGYFKLSHFSLNQFTVSNFAPRVAPNRDVLGIDIENGSRQKLRGTVIVVDIFYILPYFLFCFKISSRMS